MSVLYFVAVILGCAAQNALKKPYTKKNNGKSEERTRSINFRSNG